ncbi:hypothetical protein MBLNU459_g2926t1 [Dothideomycetes sp. NU459]
MASKVALVTASSAGLGAAIAKALGKEMRVVINYNSSRERADAVLAELSKNSALADGKSSPRYHAIQADVSRKSEIERLVKETVSTMGRLDVVVSNAGWTRMSNFADLDDNVVEEDWDRCFNVNVKSHLFLLHAARKHLDESEGSFVTVASVAGVKPSGSSLLLPVPPPSPLHTRLTLPISRLPMPHASAMRPVAASVGAGVQQLAKRSCMTSQKRSFAARAQPAVRPQFHKQHLRQSFRRTYADAPIGPEVQVAAKKGGFRTLRWIWRLTYLSALGGIGYVGYGIWQSKNPADQHDPSPDKKTLVVLGTGWGSVSLLKSLDTENYNVIVISPRNYFLFTPLLPSCTTGTIEHRSIMEPIRNFLRHKKAAVKYYEAEATKIDYEKRVVYINDDSEIKGATSSTEVPFDMLVVGVGAENATFGIPGVREHSCFLKEVGDAQRIRKRIMDCCETATFKDQSPEEIKRLLHMVVVGGGPTGVEFAGELQDFFDNDLKKWIPEIADNFKVTLVEALPSVLPMFSKQLIDYTEQTFKEETISIRTKTMVKKVAEQHIEAEFVNADGNKVLEKIPYGLLVWATGNALRPVVKDLMSQIPAQKDSRRGLAVNEYLVVKGTENIWAVGDCAVANYAPTAQVAAQEGAFLARLFNQMAKTEDIEIELRNLSEVQEKAPNKEQRDEAFASIKDMQKRLRRVKQMGPFEYSHQGSLAYIGSEKAVADISWLTGNFATGGTLTYFFWRSAYLSMCFSSRNRILVLLDWVKAKMFGRDVSRE